MASARKQSHRADAAAGKGCQVGADARAHITIDLLAGVRPEYTLRVDLACKAEVRAKKAFLFRGLP